MPTNRTKQSAQRTGIAVSPIWGGQNEQKYYKPTGEVVFTSPSLRGNPGAHQRDANLDRGWSLTPPADPKVACAGCNKWHDTHELVDACIDRHEKQRTRWQKEDDAIRDEKKGLADQADFEGRLDKLEEGLSDIKTLLQDALGVKNG